MNSDINNNRDMFYSGYYGMAPVPNMNYPYNSNMGMNNDNNYYNGNTSSNNSYYNNIENRLNRIENQIKSINQRLSRLESPNNSSYNTEPDNNMYIM